MRTFFFSVVLWSFAAAAFAQQRPLVTEDPETIGAGRVLFEAGLDYFRDASFTAAGLDGNEFRFPVIGISVGISSIAEIQLDGALYDRLSITTRRPAPLAAMVTATGDSTSDVGDLVIATKVRIVPEGARRPSFGTRFATKLPNASNESGLGLDTTDFFATVLAGKTVRSVRMVGNVGIGILGDPIRADRQNDVLTYGVSFARALTNATEVVGDLNGRAVTRSGTAPPGTETAGTIRAGLRYTVGGWRGDAGLIIGLTSRDPGVGVTAGFTYVFDAFRVP
jgi:hypothetical protein